MNEPAGIVHKGEVVFSQSDIKALGGVNRVESIRKGYSNGGIVRPLNLPSMRGSSTIRPPRMSGQGNQASIVNIHVSSMDSQDTIRALSKKEVQNHLFGLSTNAVQKTSQKSFNRSTMEFSRGG